MDISKFNFKRPSIGMIIFVVMAVGLAIAAFIFIRNFTACWTLTSLPGMAPSQCGTSQGTNSPDIQVNDQGTPIAPVVAPTAQVAAPDSALPPAWDGASRVTVLLMGLDYSDWRAGDGAPRSDTMILLTIDPLSKTAGILSVPRDLWVNIPGSGYGKINTAYSIGEGSKLPGGGPGLATKAVEQLLGINIDYYAQIDFYVFVRLIDEIGGVKVDVPADVEIDLMDNKPPKILKAGRYTLNGQYALAYARARHTKGGDVDRAQRQQQVIFAIRDRLLEPQMLPKLVAKAPMLYQEVSVGIRTDLSLDDAIRLALLAVSLPEENIKRGLMDFEHNMLIPTKSPTGLDILKPVMENIRILRDDIFTTSGALSPSAQGDPLELARQDGARIYVLNASNANGMAQSTGEYLLSQGLNITGVGNAGQIYSRTIIVLHSGKLYSLRYLRDLFQATAGAQLSIQFDPNAAADIEVYVGDDWANNNPMP